MQCALPAAALASSASFAWSLVAKRKQFTLKHLALLVTASCLGLGAVRGWYTAERCSYFEANTGLYRIESRVLGFTVRRWFERSDTHLEMIELINKHDLEYEETWLPMSSYSRLRGSQYHPEWGWFEPLERICSRAKPESDTSGEEIAVELLKIYLRAEKTQENLEPTRQQLLERLNELIGPRHKSLSF